MKQYLVFYGNSYYSSGGMGDFIGDFDNLEVAIDALLQLHKEKNPNNKKWDEFYGVIWCSKTKKDVYCK